MEREKGGSEKISLEPRCSFKTPEFSGWNVKLVSACGGSLQGETEKGSPLRIKRYQV